MEVKMQLDKSRQIHDATNLPKVFISYGSDELGLRFAHDINKRLKYLNLQTFFDKDDVYFGDNFFEKIELALASSRLVIIVVSRKFLWSKYA